MNIREANQAMTDRARVRLEDGRTGRIVRIQTDFPRGSTTLTIWLGADIVDAKLSEVDLDGARGV
jgi:hypothetical protein